MPDDAKTDDLAGHTPPPFERVRAVLFAAAPGGPGELLLQVFVGHRLVELALDLSAGDRLALAGAVATVGDRLSQAVGWDVTARTPPPAADGR